MKKFIRFIAAILSVDISNPELRKKLTNGIWITTSIFIGLLVLSIFLWQDEAYGNFGQVGDFFNGILGPILSLITIVLVYATYRVQKQELSATLEELRKTAESMQDQKKIMEMQEETQRRIRCDSIMFSMYTNYKKYYDYHRKKHLDVCAKIINRFCQKHNIDWVGLGTVLNGTISNYQGKVGLKDEFVAFFQESVPKFGEYDVIKSSVYQIISIISTPKSSGIDDKGYINHIRTYLNNQLGNYEKVFLISIFLINQEDLEVVEEDLRAFKIYPSKEKLSQYLADLVILNTKKIEGI